MGYVLPRLPKDAPEWMRKAFLRHAIAARAASNPFTARRRYKEAMDEMKAIDEESGRTSEER